MHQQGEQTYIVHWINPIIEAGDIRSIVDPRLQGEFSTNSAWRAVEVAMLCIASTAARRPDMSNVLAELKECAALDMVANTTTTQITQQQQHPRNWYRNASS
ncbi:unnamed protein product [Linum tenue]|uniref:Uncharacterized protein n=1 Tax=Linum tenue TaxID=586396 RepID=A0AAV0MYL2_9ROSI|nr:unnamed protein product [Linum tenue]